MAGPASFGWSYQGDRLTLSSTRTAPTQVAIYGLDGRFVQALHTGSLAAGTHEFRLQGLSQGAYLVRAVQGSQVIARTVFVQ